MPVGVDAGKKVDATSLPRPCKVRGGGLGMVVRISTERVYCSLQLCSRWLSQRLLERSPVFVEGLGGTLCEEQFTSPKGYAGYDVTAEAHPNPRIEPVDAAVDADVATKWLSYIELRGLRTC